MRRAFYNKCALKINRAPENRSAARFLGKRSGRRSGQGGKRSAPPAMAPWRDEAQRGETVAEPLYLGLPKSIEELFGKRSGRRNGQGGKHSEPPAMAPCQRRGGEQQVSPFLTEISFVSSKEIS